MKVGGGADGNKKKECVCCWKYVFFAVGHMVRPRRLCREKIKKREESGKEKEKKEKSEKKGPR